MKKVTAVKRKPREKKPKASVMELGLKALCSMYGADKTRPGMLAAWIPERAKFYIALHRYGGVCGTNREIVVKGYYSDLDLGISELLKEWRRISKPIEDLDACLKGENGLCK